MKSDGGVIFLTHMNFASTVYGGTDTFYNSDLLWAMVQAFINKTSGTLTGSTLDFEINVPYDFIGNLSNEVIACFAGHKHADMSGIVDGVTQVVLLNALNALGSFDAVTVDRTNRIIHANRYGMSGYDRNISY